jgi:hypothetical protein
MFAPSIHAEDCWTLSLTSYTAVIENPGTNFSILYEPRVFSTVCGAGAVVTNGTFFSGDEPLGDVIIGGQAVFSPHPRHFKAGSRSVNIGARWGIGLLKGTTILALADGDTALNTMDTFLGGGAILLKAGEDAFAKNVSPSGEWGANFSRSDILDSERSRTALGLRTVEGAQQLIVMSLKEPPGFTAATVAVKMKKLGVSDAVLYDGGGATAFAAGGQCLAFPSNPGEDQNPTHIVIKACR